MVPGARLTSQRLLDLFDLERFDDVADRDFVETFERDTAIEALFDVANVVLEALEAAHLALPEGCAFAQQADAASALDHTLDHHAASDRAGLAELEDLANLGFADVALDLGGLEQALHGRLHFIHHVVDDAVLPDFHVLF